MPFSITRVEGPPGSGKSRFLAREAIRLVVQEGISASSVLLLGVSGGNKHRLTADLSQEAKLANAPALRIAVNTLDEWLLGLINQGQPAESQWRLLSDLQTQAILGESIRGRMTAADALYYASHQPSFSRMVAGFIRQCQLQNLTPHDLQQQAAESPRLQWLAGVYEAFEAQCQAARLLTYPALIHQVSGLDLQALINLPQGILPQVILIDEAQELSEAHYRFFNQLPLALVMAGNEKLSVRSHRGAQPLAFQSYFESCQRPVTSHVLQACMRGNTAILSLLNAFLPQPVWEEQAPDLAQLDALVQFGYYRDPEAEALALAEQIAAFVAQQSVGNRPATWEDCAVLLRSSHYREPLRTALRQKNIPFWDEALSEASRHFQRDFYSLLHVFEGWERLGLQPEHFTLRQTLTAYLAQCGLSTPDTAAFMQADNRHLTRWLESVLQEGSKNQAIQHLKASKPADFEWQLPQWLEASDSPPDIVAALRALIAMYASWQAHRDPVALTRQALQALTSEALPGEDGPDAALGEELTQFQEQLSQLAERFQQATGKPILLATLLGQYETLWQPSGSPLGSKGLAAKGVRLLSIHQAQGESFAWVAIPFLVSDEFPNGREAPELLGQTEQACLPAGFNGGLTEAEEKRLFAVGASRATHQLLLSAHRQVETERILPSSFYTAMLAEKRRLLNRPSQSVVCWCETGGERKSRKACEVDACSWAPLAEAEVETRRPQETYQGSSRWADLPSQPDEPVFVPDFELITSPTAIGNYMKCPRQFYYKHLLGLPEAGNVAASLGTLVHKVMEVFNSQTPVGEYTPQRLIDIAEALFDFETNPDHFYLSGFGEREMRELSQMSPLSRSALKSRLLASIEDLKEKGYFDRYGTLKAVHAEKAFNSVTIEGIARCRFKGKVDAVIQRADGLWEVIDYKTYGPGKYGTRWALCEEKFQKTLAPLPDEEAMPHAERFAEKMNGSYPLDYQLPLYYLACLGDPAYGNQLAGVSLQLVRPQFPDNPEQGAIRLGISAEALAAQQAQLTQDIQTYIVNPILESQQFAATPAVGACDYCAYAGICEMGQTADDLGEPA
ncbi:PD-(D/E)XK nuclease family protein [Vampirovibrio sp.]|uniref:PD-(D/E)XK nuclease family protein n=1 Tax=Vampirovibrio sp. TaxID=2717857 RepID=UPI0035932277